MNRLRINSSYVSVAKARKDGKRHILRKYYGVTVPIDNGTRRETPLFFFVEPQDGVYFDSPEVTDDVYAEEDKGKLRKTATEKSDIFSIGVLYRDSLHANFRNRKRYINRTVQPKVRHHGRRRRAAAGFGSVPS